MRLYNIYDQRTLKQKLEQEAQDRFVLSFYRYDTIESPQAFRDELYKTLSSIKTLGRIYIAKEGINAQISIPNNQYDALRVAVDSFHYLKNIYFNCSVMGKQNAFLKLTIKCRQKIVNDGLENLNLNLTKQNNYVTPQELNNMLNSEDMIIIDLRNHYESEVGHFQKAVRLPVANYREAIKKLLASLKDKQDKKILLYCTGGIRCEKASVYLKNQGFRKVFQLKGGIISYFREVIENNLTSLFIGKNFVFDQRLGEKISKEIISNCYTCGRRSDDHTNCANQECHILMIQCKKCFNQYKNCCSEECREICELPEGIQKVLRRKKNCQRTISDRQ